MADVMLTTIDNPYNPFTEWNEWLQFDLASKLIWQGGDDVYKAGKKDIALLYFIIVPFS